MTFLEGSLSLSIHMKYTQSSGHRLFEEFHPPASPHSEVKTIIKLAVALPATAKPKTL